MKASLDAQRDHEAQAAQTAALKSLKAGMGFADS